MEVAGCVKTDVCSITITSEEVTNCSVIGSLTSSGLFADVIEDVVGARLDFSGALS